VPSSSPASGFWSFTQGQGQGNVDLTAFYLVGRGIVGCDHNNDPMASFAHRTCLKQGVNGWLQLDIGLGFIGGSGAAPVIDYGDIDLSFADKATGTTYTISGHTRQRFGGLQHQLCTSVAPEPATLALILPGLAGLGGLGFVRRRSRRVAA
jgi:TM2 domain-containing membrane protein YozV